MTKILTFDCYGTLIDTAPLYRWVADLATAIGIDGNVAQAAYRAYEDDPVSVSPYVDYATLVRENLKHLDGMFDQQHWFESHYVDCLALHRHLLPFADVPATLQAWREQGYQLVILSNSSWDIMPANLAALQVPFDAVITAEDVQAYKPALTFFDQAAQQLGLTKANHWHLAQGYYSDVVPAVQKQWPMIWVNRQNEAIPGTAKPTATVANLAAAKEIIG